MSFLRDAKNQRRIEPADASIAVIKSDDGAEIRIFFAAACIPEESASSKGTVVFIPGRTEFIEKFYEDIAIFRAYGFAAAAMDPRGQGLSTREHPNRHKHFVKNFDSHTQDVKAVFRELDILKAPKPYYIVAHSAGGHMALRFLHDYPDRVKQAVISAPMIDILNPGFPDFMFHGLPKLATALGAGPCWVPGHKIYHKNRSLWRSKLTHDQDRFADEDYFINTKNTDLAVGAVTYRWLYQAMRSIEILKSKDYAETITTPVLILQAAQEKIVDNQAMHDFSNRAPNVELVVIDGALHELFKETDMIRKNLWQHITRFLDLDSSLL